MEIYLVYVDTVNNNNKFWSAKVEGCNLIVQWGRIGYKPQTKTHSCNNYQQAAIKFNNLVIEKQSKGYRSSQPIMDSDRTISDIRRAIQLLNIIRPSIASRTFHDSYINAINEYLKIVPTPLGMQIDIHSIYRTVADVDHQLQLLNSLLPTTLTPTLISSDAFKDANANDERAAITTAEAKTISLKAISKNFWRHL